jgi:DNA-binding CsgD family transcriptional regulator
VRTSLDLPDAELARRYAEGESIKRLSLAYGCSPATVAKRLRAQGAAIRAARYRPITVPRDELERLYLRERLPLREIAARLGVSPSTVGGRRRAFGIPARSSRGRRPKAVEQQRRLAARRALWHALRT